LRRTRTPEVSPGKWIIESGATTVVYSETLLREIELLLKKP